MIRYSLFLTLFGISAYCVAGTVAHEAIVGSSDVVDEHTFLYQAYIPSVVHGRKYGCGGGIIDKHYVITAAHCVIDRNGDASKVRDISVITGTFDLNSDHKIISRVTKIYWPKKYTDEYYYNPDSDFAFLELKVALPLSTNKRLNQLTFPRPNEIYRMHQLVKIAGFGNGGHKLQAINARLLKDKGCRLHYDEYLCARVDQATNNHLKAHGVCAGDEGGPLTIAGRLIGVLVKAANHCSENHSAGLYIRMADYLVYLRLIVDYGPSLAKRKNMHMIKKIMNVS